MPGALISISIVHRAQWVRDVVNLVAPCRCDILVLDTNTFAVHVSPPKVTLKRLPVVTTSTNTPEAYERRESLTTKARCSITN